MSTTLTGYGVCKAGRLEGLYLFVQGGDGGAFKVKKEKCGPEVKIKAARGDQSAG